MDLGIKIIETIQSVASPFWDSFFETVTMLGEETFYILIFTIIYWCIDKKLGARICFIFIFSTIVNAGLKEIIHTKRIIGTEGIRSLRIETATGYSFPSGHTQGVATFWMFLMNHFKKKSLYVVGSMIILLVAFSRLYLGVHWPLDVIGGIIIALICVIIGNKMYNILIKEKRYTYLILIALVFSLLAFIFTEPGYIKSAALFLGIIVGIILEQKCINYVINKKLLFNIIKVLLGLIVLLLIKEGIKIILPRNYFFHYLRYLLIGLWATLGAPALFKKVKI